VTLLYSTPGNHPAILLFSYESASNGQRLVSCWRGVAFCSKCFRLRFYGSTASSAGKPSAARQAVRLIPDGSACALTHRNDVNFNSEHEWVQPEGVAAFAQSTKTTAAKAAPRLRTCNGLLATRPPVLVSAVLLAEKDPHWLLGGSWRRMEVLENHREAAEPACGSIPGFKAPDRLYTFRNGAHLQTS